MEFLELLDHPALASYVQAQLVAYVRSVNKLGLQIFKDVSPEDAAKNVSLFTLKCAHFIDTRDARVDEINTPECMEARDVKARIYPFDVPNLILCLDGRVLSKLIGGLRGHAYRTPAGDSTEFKPGENGEMFLQEGQFTHLIEKTIKERLADPKYQDSSLPIVMFEVFDSHVACAAKGLEVQRETLKKDNDGGLYKDVLRKKAMIGALGRYMSKRYAHYPRIKTVGAQISFDVHNGYIYMGLEKDECLNAAKKTGFTSEVLNELVSSGKIISTKNFAENSDLTPLLQEYWFDLDYETRYAKDTQIFFRNVEKMMDRAMPIVEAKLISVYSGLSTPDKEDELRQRAVLVLSNAYGSYLFNNKVDFETKAVTRKKYPYAFHDESLIAVIYSERGPYDRARAFSDDPKDPNLYDSIVLQQGIIRENRRKGMMSEYELRAVFKLKLERSVGEDDAAFDERVKRMASETYNIAQEAAISHAEPTFSLEIARIIDDYRRNPIPVMLFERLTEDPSASSLEALHDVDWSDLTEIDWMNMSDYDFKKYVANKVHQVSKGETDLSADAADKINELRHRAMDLYGQYALPATKDFLAGRLIPVWTLADKYRKTIAIIPFVAQSYVEPQVIHLEDL